MAAFDSAAADFLFKKLYADGLDEEALTSGNQLLKWVDHNKKFTSAQGMGVPAPYANAQGISATHAGAVSRTQPGKGVQFLVPQRKMVQLVEIDGDVITNAINGGDYSQFTNAFTREIDGASQTFGQELNQRLYRGNNGFRALVHASTAPSTTTLTLKNPQDSQFFEVGMYVAAFDTATGTLRNAGAAVLVTAVDPAAGTLTGSTNWTTTIAALAVGDSLIRADMNLTSLDGLDGWVPVTPVANFLGVNQTLYRTRLAGVYYDASNQGIRQGYLNAFGYARTQIGGKFEQKCPIFINPANFIQLVQSVEAVKIVDTKLDTKYNVGLDAVEVLGNTFVQDRHCPVNQAWLVPKGAFTLGTAGQYDLEDVDGGKFFYNRRTGILEATCKVMGNAYSDGSINMIGRLALPDVNA